MKTIIQIDQRQPQNKRFFELQLLRALEGLEDLASHASLKLTHQPAEAEPVAGAETSPGQLAASAYSCRVALAVRNWGIVVAEASAETAALAMDRALQQLRSAAKQVVLPESRSPIISRSARFVCC